MSLRLLFVTLLLAVPVRATAAEDGAALYKRCAACHLPTRAGVPGAYPPLDDHIAAFATSEEGRTYLVTTILRGVAGPIDVNGVAYRGVMPAQAGLKDAQIAALLNYLVAEDKAARFEEAEVAAIREKHQKTSAQQVRALRAEIPKP